MILIVDCCSWSITCKIKDSCKRSTSVCYSAISICKIAPKHLVHRFFERHPLEFYDLDFFGRRKRYKELRVFLIDLKLLPQNKF